MAKRRRDPGGRQDTIIETTIERLGARGDGVAAAAGATLYLPYALPGEQVRARLTGRRGDGLTGRVEAILAPAAARVPPVCRHFTDCGGCALQHVEAACYAAFKRAQIIAALRRRGFADPPVGEPVSCPPASRRRATFAVRRTAAGCVIGFHAAASDRIVAIQECPVTAPAIVALLPALADCLVLCLPSGATADILVTLLGGELDIVITGPGSPDLAIREALAGLAQTADLARLSWQTAGSPDSEPEPIAARRPIRAAFGGVAVAVPAGAFLQATEAGERAIVGAVLAAAPARGKVVDLFAGCGTLTFPLAASGLAVHAVELDRAAQAALAAAARAARLPITAERRDLVQRPLSGDELAGYAAVVFDPPRAGAAAQAAALASSAVPVVIAVSCHAASFARDARILADGGYRLIGVQPIDQFLWSAHIELVAVFTRAAPIVDPAS